MPTVGPTRWTTPAPVRNGVGDTDIWRDEEGNFIIASFNSIELCTDDSDGDILLTTATGKVLYNGEEVATQDWTTNQGYITDNEVPSVQTSSVVVTNATTNVNGRTFQHYTATLTTAGGFTYYQILKDGVNPTEAEAAEYMKYMTGSTFVPKYNYDFPKQVIFTFADRSTWKPQYSTSDGLRLYRLTTPLALESQIPDAVSGTNDGTNWTSLTIGSDTYGLASGGSSTGGYTVDFTFAPNGLANCSITIEFIHPDGTSTSQTFTFDGSSTGTYTVHKTNVTGINLLNVTNSASAYTISQTATGWVSLNGKNKNFLGDDIWAATGPNLNNRRFYILLSSINCSTTLS